MEYNTNDLGKGTTDFVVTESHRKDDIRCNPVQPFSSEIRSLNVEEEKDRKRNLWYAKKPKHQ